MFDCVGRLVDQRDGKHSAIGPQPSSFSHQPSAIRHFLGVRWQPALDNGGELVRHSDSDRMKVSLLLLPLLLRKRKLAREGQRGVGAPLHRMAMRPKRPRRQSRQMTGHLGLAVSGADRRTEDAPLLQTKGRLASRISECASTSKLTSWIFGFGRPSIEEAFSNRGLGIRDYYLNVIPPFKDENRRKSHYDHTGRCEWVWG